MLHQSTDKIISFPAQTVSVLIALERIDSVSVQRQIDVHSRSIGFNLRLWHESSVKSVPLCDRLDNHLKRHQIIRGHQRFIITEIDLMLRRSDLMMGRSDLKSHVLQCQHHIPPGILAKIKRAHIKISALLMCQRRRQAVIIHVEKEKLTFRSHIHRIPHFFCLSDRLFQNIPGIHLIGRPICAVDVTDQTRHFPLLGSPREDLKGTQIRIKIHIRVLFSGKPFQRGHVKHTAVIQRLFQLAYRYSHIFHRSEDIRKLQPDESHILFLHDTENIFPRIVMH